MVTRDILFRFLGDSKSIQRASKDASRAMSPLGRVADTVNQKFGKLAKAAAPVGIAVTGAIGLSIRSFANFDDALTKSVSIMGDVSSSMRNDLAEAAREVGRTTRFGAEQAAEAFFFLASAGLSAEESIAALPKVAEFATAGNFDLALATDLVTDAQSALGLASDDAEESLNNLVRVQDVLVKANTLANASVQQFSEALTNKAGAAIKVVGKDIEEGTAVLAAFADQGVKGAEAGTALNIVFRDLQTKAIANKDAFKDLGVAVFDSNGEMRNIADIVSDLEGALEGMSDEQKKATLAQLGFTDKSISFIQTLLGSSDAIREYEAELRNAGGTTKDVADKQLTSMSAQLDLALSKFKDVGLTIGEALIPAVVDFANVLASLVDSAPFGFLLRSFENFATNFELGLRELEVVAKRALTFGLSDLFDGADQLDREFTSALRNAATEAETTEESLVAAAEAFVFLGQRSAFSASRLNEIQDALGLTDDQMRAVTEDVVQFADANDVSADAVKFLNRELADWANAAPDHISLLSDMTRGQEAKASADREAGQALLAVGEEMNANSQIAENLATVNTRSKNRVLDHSLALTGLESDLRSAASAQQSLADVMRAAIDPVFAARRASLRYAEVLRRIDEDGKRTNDELLELAAAKLELDGAFENLDSVQEVDRAVEGLARTLGISQRKARAMLEEMGLLDGLVVRPRIRVGFDVEASTINIGGGTIPVFTTGGGQIILHEGGIVPGPRGQEVAAVLEAGERVISLDEQDRMARQVGNGNPIGGGGGNLHFNFQGPLVGGPQLIEEIRTKMVLASRRGAAVQVI